MRKHILVLLVASLAFSLSACSDDSPSERDERADVIDESDVKQDEDAIEPDAGEQDAGDPDVDEADADESDADESDTISTDAPNLIFADDQVVAAAESNQVTIRQAKVEADAFVVVHQECIDCLVPGPGEIVGHVAIEAGDHSDIAVTLDHNVSNGQTYYAMLHEDTDADGTFDFVEGGQADGPLSDETNTSLVDSFVVNVASIIVTNQTLDDLSTTVNISEIYSDGAGWVVIREGACADDGALIGEASTQDGSTVNLPVSLYRPALSGETLCAVLHADTGLSGNFEFDANNPDTEDAPVQLADDSIVRAQFDVMVPDGVPAVRITLSNAGDQEYMVDAVEPHFFGAGLLDVGNPSMGLMNGWRYEIVNLATAEQPFEFIVKGSTAGGFETADLIVLSQAAPGTGEGDAEIDWVEDGNAMRFTVAGESWTGVINVNGYRSANATGRMRGDVAVYIQ
ncbi:DUF7282 domain-containing protein [Bradymonas sediminis]|uniref:DUF7282 domain-containing protein n=1 Tax=Bradymonas sediminis TaxID=1548548 RepID=UPI0010611F43|nr:hypothetical protein [Bradymonas sediminis]TDP73748.1 hypothetical protein DFR33_10580 [Bradymonas sediminis]